jgi:DNA-binding response OmpR family regulator
MLSVRDDSYSAHQMLAERSDQSLSRTPTGPAPSRPRLALIDRDSGFMQVLSKRLLDRSWDHTIVASAVTPQALVRMRLNALVVDVTVVGPDCWSYLESVCTRLPGLAVIVCTGPSSVAQRVRGLRLGVDAWVTKPCHPEELICVIEATLRRHRRSELAVLDPPTMAAELMIRPELHQAFVGEVSVELTAREFEILQLLVQSDRVLRREEIYERVWGYAMAHGDRSVDVFVRKLRQKLGSASPGWDYIHTHFGVGYRFAPVPNESFLSEEVSAPQPQAERSHLVYTSVADS